MKELKQLQNLIAGHAYWSDKIRDLKWKGSHHASKCERIIDVSIGSPTFPKTCFDLAHDLFVGHDNDFIDFDVIWTESDDFDPCYHCIKVRDYKLERVGASMRRGAIRAAMTRLGRKLDYHDKGNLVTGHNLPKIDFDEDVSF